jgi:hypothetical protein
MILAKFEQVAKYWNRSRYLRDAFNMGYIGAISPLRLMSASLKT